MSVASLYMLGWTVIFAHDFLDVLFRNSTRFQSGVFMRTVLSASISVLLRKSLLWLLPDIATSAVFCVLVLHALVQLGVTLVTRLCAVFLDAIGNVYGSITMPSPSPPPRPHASGGNPTEPAGFTGQAAVLDESDAVRLALLICSCYERASARRRVCKSTSEGTVDASPNAADDVDDTTGDAASRKRRELLGLFYLLATSQLSRPGLDPVLGTPHLVQASAATLECDGKAALASGTSIHNLVVSASTSHGLDLALAAREQHDSPVSTNVSVPEPPVPCSSSPDVSDEDGELHEVTRDRDLFRTRAYQLAFKVDDLHNRHSQTLCALERAEAVIEELQRDKMNAVVALASVVVSATSSGHPPRSRDSLEISSSLSTIAFSPPSVSGHSTTSGSGAAPTSDARHLLADSHSQTAALDDVVLYPRTPTRCFTPAAGLVPTEPLLLPVVDDGARSLTPGGDLDGSWRKRASTWALSPRKESAASASGQAPSITKSLLGKIPWLRKGGRKHELEHDQDATGDELGVEVEAVKALRPLPSSWLPAGPDTGLDCALEPEETAGDGQVNLAGSAAGSGKGDEHPTIRGTRKQHGLGTDGWNSSTTLHPSDDSRSSASRRQSWVQREAGPQHGDYGAAQSAARRNGHSNLERNGRSTKGPGLGMRTQRSTSSLGQNSYGRDGASRARTSTGNWRAERVDGLEDDPEALDGSRHKSQSKSKRGRRSFGFGAGTTKADEMRRQNAPYFQGLQGQGPHLRRSQSTIGIEARSSTAGPGVDGDLRRRSSLAEKLQTGGGAASVMDNVWNRRAQERAAAAAERVPAWRP
ncbi:hypothetical protein OH76DRAFT_368676 [Lentinus brumalis]|uniref:Uncharacterized protein n=1 Tax=Lentinus brumalis TaxID=2498619 RepID=A0A371DEB3_9APHY|nr:hypothetical protein OH76DRAFT_368676 [Polyporus brumalis]